MFVIMSYNYKTQISSHLIPISCVHNIVEPTQVEIINIYVNLSDILKQKLRKPK